MAYCLDPPTADPVFVEEKIKQALALCQQNSCQKRIPPDSKELITTFLH